MPTAGDALARIPRASEGASCLVSGRSHCHEEEKHGQKAAGAWGIMDADADSMLARPCVTEGTLSNASKNHPSWNSAFFLARRRSLNTQLLPLAGWRSDNDDLRENASASCVYRAHTSRRAHTRDRSCRAGGSAVE